MKPIQDCRELAQQCLQHYINNSSCKTVEDVIKAVTEHLFITLMTLHCATNENHELINAVLDYCQKELEKPGQSMTLVGSRKPNMH